MKLVIKCKIMKLFIIQCKCMKLMMHCKSMHAVGDKVYKYEVGDIM